MLEPGQRILEGVLTTLSARGELNIAPMGPIVGSDPTRFLLRPFRESTTYRNLRDTQAGVFHVTDDVLLIARGALGQIDSSALDADLEAGPAQVVRGVVLRGCCRWSELEVLDWDDSTERTRVSARAVATGRGREFFGFNRAMHAVLEASILATRLHLTGAAPVLAELDRLAVVVSKTGSSREHEAMRLLREHVMSWTAPAAGVNT
jgi:hypothetical protein